MFPCIILTDRSTISSVPRTVTDKRRFAWTKFYEAIADKLLTFRNNRAALVAGIYDIIGHVDGLANWEDHYKDGTTGKLRDICPFTAFGIFNRGNTEANRKNIASAFAAFLGVREPVPKSFEGIPILNNQRSWFFSYENKRLPNDIESLWSMFAEALHFADAQGPDSRNAFIKTYDDVAQRFGVGWNLTMGLYWIRPWVYPTLESQSQNYISNKLRIDINRSGPKGRCTGNDYFGILEMLETRFQEEAFPVHSFPELSLAAWHYQDDTVPPNQQNEENSAEIVLETEVTSSPIEPYTVDIHGVISNCRYIY
jgi:5-methylcytosine-specific restriction protein B